MTSETFSFVCNEEDGVSSVTCQLLSVIHSLKLLFIYQEFDG